MHVVGYVLTVHRQVFFCTAIPRTTKQMVFRPSREEDYLGSYFRQHIFQNLLQRELTFNTIFGRSNENYDHETRVLLTDSDNPLPEWQDEFAPNHWQREFIHSVVYVSFPAGLPLNIWCLSGSPVIFTRLTLE